MEKYLTLVFLSESGKNVSVKIDNPREDLQAEEVKSAMEGIITKKVLIGTDDAYATSIVSAEITSKSVSEFAVK